MLLVWKVPLNNTATTSLHASVVSTCCASLKALLGYVDRKSYVGSCSQWLKIGREVSKICSLTDRNKQTYPVRISVPSPRRGNKMCAGVCRHGAIAVSHDCGSLHSGSQPSVDAYFQSMHRSSATHCHLTSNHPRLCPSSVNVLKHSFFASLFLI